MRTLTVYCPGVRRTCRRICVPELDNLELDLSEEVLTSSFFLPESGAEGPAMAELIMTNNFDVVLLS